MADTIKTVRSALTITEWIAIGSLAISICVGIFTGGVMYGQVDKNSQDIAELKPKVDAISTKIERIDANVEFLAGLAKEERARR